MGRLPYRALAWLTVVAALAAGPAPGAAPSKDQSRLEGNEEVGPHILDSVPDTAPSTQESEPEEIPPALEPDDIPALATVELTEDSAKRAIDGFAAVRDKYTDQGIDDYETLEEFVSKTEAGKRLEADVKGFGFGNITQWNTTIMAVSFAYAALEDGQEQAIRDQIEDVKADTSLDETARTRMIASLNALIPSEGNKAVIKKLNEDPSYREKLKLLDEGE